MTSEPAPGRLSAADEKAHPLGSDPLACESWYFDFASPKGDLGGAVRIALLPNLGRAWYWGCVVGEGRQLVTVIDHDVPLPSRPGSLELRAEGLWADHIVETAFDHVTVGAEAFAVGVDDAAEVYLGEPRGDRVPFGLDLEWETDGGVFGLPGGTGYEVPCRVHGEVLVGREVIDLDGFGHRNHTWGVADWWSGGWCWTAGRLDDGTRFHGVTGRDEGAGYLAAPGAAPEPIPRQLQVTETAPRIGGHAEFTSGATIDLGSLAVDVDPVAWSPVLLSAADGRQSRLARCLSRFTTPDGRTGVGWTEWNQPQDRPPRPLT